MKKQLMILTTLTVLIYGDSISYLNDIRESVGLNKLTPQVNLQKAASKHAKYLLKHSLNSHYETEGAYFSAKTPALRAIQNGYATKDVKENIATNTTNAKEAIDVLFSAIYHRFVFLDFAIDQIGEGIAKDTKQSKIKSAYVYDVGLSSVASLCQKDYLTLNGVYYMQNLCKDSMHYVPKDDYIKAKEQIMSQNPKMVLFPNTNQADVPTAFYQEHPHPMPGYKVSGYPISVELNPYYFQDIKIKKFKLYDTKGKMVRVKLLKFSNDPNKKLKPYQFAIIPKQRLAYDSTYKVLFEAYTDKGKIKQQWSFHTKSFKYPLYTITHSTTIHTNDKSKVILYFKPKNRKDIIENIKVSNATINYIDANTIQVTIHKKPATIITNKTRKVILK